MPPCARRTRRCCRGPNAPATLRSARSGAGAIPSKSMRRFLPLSKPATAKRPGDSSPHMCNAPARRFGRFWPKPRSAGRRPDHEHPASQPEHAPRHHRPHANGWAARRFAGNISDPLHCTARRAVHIDARRSADRRGRRARNARGASPAS